MRDDTPFRRLPSIVVALLLLMPVAALADDFEPFDAYGDQEEDLDEQVSSTSPAPAPTPRASAPDRSAARPATRAGSSAPAAAASTDNRPTSPWSVGIGAGWVFAGATNLLQPNTASVRVGLGKRFAIEPSVVLGLNEGKDHSFTDDPRLDAEQEIEQGDKTNALAMGVHGRMVLTSRGNLDLQALAGLTVSRTSAEPFAWDLVEDEDLVDGEYESYAVRTSVSWGVGVQWHFKSNLALSADAMNPLASWSRSGQYSRDEVTVIDNEGQESTEWREQLSHQTQSDIGLVFNPNIRVMLHLYF